jgi:hypothetical protein
MNAKLAISLLSESFGLSTKNVHEKRLFVSLKYHYTITTHYTKKVTFCSVYTLKRGEVQYINLLLKILTGEEVNFPNKWTPTKTKKFQWMSSYSTWTQDINNMP